MIIKSQLPSCSDGEQNQGEAGIDCGGPCKLCDWQLQKELEVVFAEALETKDNYVDLVAKIKNPNREFGAKSFLYKFNLYDSSNNLIFSKDGSSYILPQETRYVVEQKLFLAGEVSRTEFKVQSVTWQKLSDYQEPELLIGGQSFDQQEELSRVIGTLENRSNYDFDRIDIYGVLFDKESKILGVGKTEVRTVLSKESRYFEISWFFPLEGRIERTDVSAETNVFLDENFMKRHGNGIEKFQEY